MTKSRLGFQNQILCQSQFTELDLDLLAANLALLASRRHQNQTCLFEKPPQKSFLLKAWLGVFRGKWKPDLNGHIASKNLIHKICHYLLIWTVLASSLMWPYQPQKLGSVESHELGIRGCYHCNSTLDLFSPLCVSVGGVRGWVGAETWVGVYWRHTEHLEEPKGGWPSLQPKGWVPGLFIWCWLWNDLHRLFMLRCQRHSTGRSGTCSRSSRRAAQPTARSKLPGRKCYGFKQVSQIKASLNLDAGRETLLLAGKFCFEEKEEEKLNNSCCMFQSVLLTSAIK